MDDGQMTGRIAMAHTRSISYQTRMSALDVSRFSEPNSGVPATGERSGTKQECTARATRHFARPDCQIQPGAAVRQNEYEGRVLVGSRYELERCEWQLPVRHAR